MIENIIKKMLRKWLKKKVYSAGAIDATREVEMNAKRFDWVYNAPLREWRDRIWVLRHHASYWEDILNKEIMYITEE